MSLPLIEESDHVRIVMFPPELLAFQIELDKHPDLTAELTPDMSWLQKIETLAARLEIVLDGMYIDAELVNLFRILTQRMRERNKGLVITIYSDLSNTVVPKLTLDSKSK